MLVVFAGIGALIGYAFMDRDPPVQVLSERRLRSLTPNPLLNETLDYETDFIRTKWCQTKVNRWFINSEGKTVMVAPLPYSMRTDGLFYPQTSVTKINIPVNLPSGPTLWCFRPEWKCNSTQNEIFWPGPIIGNEECITFWVNNPDIPYAPVEKLDD
jgi:hypothetical protein